MADSIDLTAYNKQVVKLGADDSSFVFEAERVEKVDYPVSKEDLRVILLSDTYLPDIADCKLLLPLQKCVRSVSCLWQTVQMHKITM